MDDNIIEGRIVRADPSYAGASAPLSVMPAMGVADATARYQALVSFTRGIMRRDVDYGVIPGTAKPTLLKPGAEKLSTYFGLTTRPRVVQRIEHREVGLPRHAERERVDPRLDVLVRHIRDILGEAIKACVVLKDGTSCTKKELLAHCRKNLPAYKVPQQIEFYQRLPKTTSGKIKKNELKESQVLA